MNEKKIIFEAVDPVEPEPPIDIPEVNKSTEKKETTAQYSDRIITWERNHELIRNAFIEYVQLNKTSPTITFLKNITGLNWKTIKKHMEEGLDIKACIGKHRILSEKVLMAIYDSAIHGDTSSQKLWFELTERDFFAEKKVKAEVQEPIKIIIEKGE